MGVVAKGSCFGDTRITGTNLARDTCHRDGIRTIETGDYTLADNAIPAPIMQPRSMAAARSVNDWIRVPTDAFSFGYRWTRSGDAFLGGVLWKGALGRGADDVAAAR